MEEALAQCCAFNSQIEASKQSRGPFYFDLKTSSVQCTPARLVSRVLPSSSASSSSSSSSSLVEIPAVVVRDESAYSSVLVQSMQPQQRAKDRALLAPAPRTEPSETCAGCARGVDSSALTCAECCNSWHLSCVQGHVGQQQMQQPKSFLCHLCRSCERCARGPVSEKEPLLDCHKCGISRHVHCAEPVLVRRPSGLWLCAKCVVCESCGTRVAPSWHENSAVCGPCVVRRRQGDACPVCYNVLVENEPGVRCGTCLRFVHANGRCDGGVVTEALWQALKTGADATFVCSVCSLTPELVPVPDAELDRMLDERLKALGRIDGGAITGAAASSGGSLKKVASEAKLRKPEAVESSRSRRAGTRKRYEGEDADEREEYEMEEEEDDEVVPSSGRKGAHQSDESFNDEDEEDFALSGSRKRSTRTRH